MLISTSAACDTGTARKLLDEKYIQHNTGIPDDVSVVGFDGLGHQNLTEPKITTVVQPVYEISKLLASSILSRILDGRKKRFCRLIEGEVKVEGSVKRIKE